MMASVSQKPGLMISTQPADSPGAWSYMPSQAVPRSLEPVPSQSLHVGYTYVCSRDIREVKGRCRAAGFPWPISTVYVVTCR